VHLHPYYRDRFGTTPGLCPVSETAYDKLLSLPIYPAMQDADIEEVVLALQAVTREMGER
jgi:perosamine synthetase